MRPRVRVRKYLLNFHGSLGFFNVSRFRSYERGHAMFCLREKFYAIEFPEMRRGQGHGMKEGARATMPRHLFLEGLPAVRMACCITKQLRPNIAFWKVCLEREKELQNRMPCPHGIAAYSCVF